MCSITGAGERLHKFWGQFDLGTLDSGERSLPFGLLAEFPFHKEISSEKVLENLPPTMTLTSIGMIINKREC